jgi:hypothetical protein
VGEFGLIDAMSLDKSTSWVAVVKMESNNRERINKEYLYEMIKE